MKYTVVISPANLLIFQGTEQHRTEKQKKCFASGFDQNISYSEPHPIAAVATRQLLYNLYTAVTVYINSGLSSRRVKWILVESRFYILNTCVWIIFVKLNNNK